jgi:hypothetical protein
MRLKSHEKKSWFCCLASARATSTLRNETSMVGVTVGVKVSVGVNVGVAVLVGRGVTQIILVVGRGFGVLVGKATY